MSCNNIMYHESVNIRNPITHQAMFKLHKGKSLQDTLPIMEEYYQRIEAEIEGVRNASIFFNCVNRNTNCDIMVVLEMDGKEVLNIYLEHPLHKELQAKVENLVYLVGGIDYSNILYTTSDSHKEQIQLREEQ